MSYITNQRKESMKRLSGKELQFFNDKTIPEQPFQSADQMIQVYAKKLQQCYYLGLNKFCLRLSRIPLFHQQHRLFLDIIHLIVILIWFILIPLHFAFPSKININSLSYALMACLIFPIDMLIQLNTSFYRQGKLVVDRGEITRNYIQNRLFNDVITLLPILYHKFIKEDSSSHDLIISTDIFLIIFYLKYFHFQKMKRKLTEVFNTKRTFRYYYDLTELLFTMLTLAHIYACVWVYTAQHERSRGASRYINIYI